MENSRLVYSTDTGRTCPACERPKDKCRCGKKSKESARDASAARPAPRDGVARVQLETAGRKGKTVTVVYGIDLAEPELKELARHLKNRCGAGGSVKDGAVIVQGDHREAILSALGERGFSAKRSGR